MMENAGDGDAGVVSPIRGCPELVEVWPLSPCRVGRWLYLVDRFCREARVIFLA
jgi:hypothetical protein